MNQGGFRNQKIIPKNRINMDGRNFNQKLFNKVFDDNNVFT